MKWIDLLHARYHNDGLFFSGGFGHEDILTRSLVDVPDPEDLDLAPLTGSDRNRIVRFGSPCTELLPPESKVAEALVVLPTKWSLKTPICVQLAATGDQGFLARQRFVAEPLLESGIGSVILENPYYGCRRPSEQKKTYLHTVSDLWAMGLAVVAEARALLNWLNSQGFQALGVCGVSMGGAMASQVTALYGKPLAMCACIAPHCATPVFLEGVLSRYIDWTALNFDLGRQRLAAQLDGSNLSLFPKPVRSSGAIWLAAKKDAYVPPESSAMAAKLWPGSELRWLNNSHVGTTIFHKNQYIQAIVDSFRLTQSALPDHLFP